MGVIVNTYIEKKSNPPSLIQLHIRTQPFKHPHPFIISLIEFRGVNTGRHLRQFLVSSFPASSQNQNCHQGEYPCCLHITISLICPISPTVVSTIARIPKKAKESLKPPLVADRVAKALDGFGKAGIC